MAKQKMKTNLKSEDLLMKSATRLFGRRGYDGVSVKEIANHADVNVALISYHFGNKLGLYRACIEQFGRTRLESIQRILMTPSTRQKVEICLEMFIGEMIEANMENPDLSAIIHRECEIMNKNIEDIFRTTFLQSFKTLRQFFKVAKDRKLIRANIDPMATAAIFFSVISHMTRMNRAHEYYLDFSIQKTEVRKKFVQQAIQILLKGTLLGEEEKYEKVSGL